MGERGALGRAGERRLVCPAEGEAREWGLVWPAVGRGAAARP